MKRDPLFFFLSDPVQIQYDYTKLCHEPESLLPKGGYH
jgi:hypothetical protein